MSSVSCESLFRTLGAEPVELTEGRRGGCLDSAGREGNLLRVPESAHNVSLDLNLTRDLGGTSGG